VNAGIILFATDEQLRLLGDCSALHMDGTFKTCPRPFAQVMLMECVKKIRIRDIKHLNNFQLYVIQGRYRDRVIALGFALMKRKKRANYRQLFNILSDRYENLTGVPLAPRLVITDYEVKY
jgi:hypothetical protein